MLEIYNSEGCPYCAIAEPILDQLANEYDRDEVIGNMISLKEEVLFEGPTGKLVGAAAGKVTRDRAKTAIDILGINKENQPGSQEKDILFSEARLI